MRGFRSKSVLLLALAAIACESKAYIVDPSNDLPAAITITAPSSSLSIGQSAQLAAVVMDKAGKVLSDKPVTWSSSNTRIATVSATGLIAGIAIGTVTVNATTGDKTAATAITVASAATVPGDTTSGAAIQPRLFSTPMPASPGKTIGVAAGGDLQAALDVAQPGDVVQLAPGATYIGNFVLRNKNTSSTDWIVVRPSIPDASFPEGSRMTPTRAAALRLPRVLSPNSQPAIQTALGAHHYRLVGLEVGVEPSQTINYGVITFGAGADAGQTTLASVAHDLVVDRSYVHGSPRLDLSRCVALNSASSAVIDSYLSECHASGIDAQAIAGWNGPGPFKIVNNYLEGAAENILFGGADPGITNLIPSDIEIRRNHIAKPVAWRGGPWQIKNLFELKNAQRVLVEGNIFENNWEAAQDGTAMQLQSNNQDGTAPWSRTWDVTIRSNIIRNTGAGITFTATNGANLAVDARRFTVSNNLIDNIDVPGFKGTGRAFLFLGGVADAMVAHNTVPRVTNSAISFDQSQRTTSSIRLVVRDNVLAGGPYAITGANTGVGLASWRAWAPDGVFLNNVLIADTAGTSFPANNFYPNSLSLVGFAGVAAGDFHLTLTSPYKNKATDGRDIGVDMDVLQAAVAGVVTP